MDQDVRLMLGFQQGSVHDFERLVERNYRSVLNLAYRFIGERVAAEDVAQEVFLQIFKTAAAYSPNARFTTWLYTITRNACYSELRRRRRRPGPLEEADDQLSSPMAPDSLEQAELQSAVKEAIASLPDNQRMAVLLLRHEDLSYEQIAEVMAVSVSAVKALLHRARQRLKTKLKELTAP